MKWKKCDVCGYRDKDTKVLASTLGPVSFAYCRICRNMTAEPDLECEDRKRIIFDREADRYKMKASKHYLDIISGDNVFKTRMEAIKAFKMEDIEYKED